jgi:hypothetical protein
VRKGSTRGARTCVHHRGHRGYRGSQF